MSMCYLCNLCANKLDGDHLNTCVCLARYAEHRKLSIDYGKQDPKEVCKHFEPKVVGE